MGPALPDHAFNVPHRLVDTAQIMLAKAQSRFFPKTLFAISTDQNPGVCESRAPGYVRWRTERAMDGA